MKNRKQLFPIFLCFCILFSFHPMTLSAKTESSSGQLVTKALEGNIGPVTGPGKSIIIREEAEQIKKGVKFSFVSNGTSVVKVDSKTGMLEGIKPGNADIIVRKTYKGKTSVLGTCKVTIRESSVSGSKKVAVGKFTINGKNENPKAVYTYESEDSSVVTAGKAKTSLKALKEGTTVVTVYETYQNRTRKTGSAAIYVTGAAMRSNIPSFVLAKGQSKSFNCTDYLEYVNKSAAYGLTTKNKDIIQVGKDKSGTVMVEAVKAGTAKLVFTEKIDKKTQNIGMITVTVKNSIPCKDIYFDENFTSISADTMGEEPYTITIHMSEGESMELSELTHLDPSNTTDRLIYSSENQEVLRVDENTGTMTALKEGTAEFLLTCGKVIQAGTVNVVKKDADSDIQKMAAETVSAVQKLTRLPIQEGQLVKVYNERVKVSRQIGALEKAYNKGDISDGMSMAVLLPNEKAFNDYSKKLMAAIQAESSLFQTKKAVKDTCQVIPKIKKISFVKQKSLSILWEKPCNTADILYGLYANAPETLYQSGMALTLPMEVTLSDRGHFYTNAVMTLKNGKKTGTVAINESLVKENYKISCKESYIFADKTAEKEFSYR